MACGRDEDALGAQLVKVILANAMYKGSDVRLATGTMLRPDTWPRKSLMPWWWRWAVVMSYNVRSEHINVLEMRALTSGLRWKLRSGANMGRRHVFALDSQVVIGVAVKGRTSSQQLRNALLQFNLLILSTS
eukprot:12398238-Karenia_brevis.AAC.1